jgi:hypothetical protein
MPELLAPDRVDWRWARVLELTQYSDTEALPRLRHEDEVTRRAFRFKRMFDKGLGDEFPEMHAAHHIYINQPHYKDILEVLLLSGASDEKILDYVWAKSCGVITSYHDLFFAVRPGLSKPGWICASVFGGMPHQSVHHLDRHGIMLRMAWYGGLSVVEDMLKGGILSADVQDKLRSVMKDALLRNAAETALTLNNNSEQAPDLLRITMDMPSANSDKDVSPLEEVVDDFLGGLTLTVADPTDKRNLSLPAKEVCDVDYEVLKDG